MVDRYWRRFHLATRDHFYHSGARIENRQPIVEALVFNFDAAIAAHNHDVPPLGEPLSLFGSNELLNPFQSE